MTISNVIRDQWAKYRAKPKVYANNVTVAGTGTYYGPSNPAPQIAAATAAMSNVHANMIYGNMMTPHSIKSREVLCECQTMVFLHGPPPICASCQGKKIPPTPRTEFDLKAAWGIPRPLSPNELTTFEKIKNSLSYKLSRFEEADIMNALINMTDLSQQISLKPGDPHFLADLNSPDHMVNFQNQYYQVSNTVGSNGMYAAKSAK